ncbi:trypsin beta-like [Drosophila tropicalis]|uniref:trypsin beta-like n=1 Tax=Drosophila tropicalis TaxID=46794 RepID=UPI0035AC20C2
MYYQLIGVVVIVALAASSSPSTWSQYQYYDDGDYVDNGTYYLIYRKPVEEPPQSQIIRHSMSNHLPLSYFGNISSNPQINALEMLDELPTRIVGGKKIGCRVAPYQAALHFEGYFICGGVIISRRWILTAHHCIVGRAGKYQVRVGSTQQRRGGQLRRVELIVANKKYNKNTMQNDIALLKLRDRLKYGPCVKRAHLPPLKLKTLPRCFLVSGWGLTSASATNVQRYLRGVVVCKTGRWTCARAYAKAGVQIYRQMLCARRKGRDSCSGDSGGPLVHSGIVYGIVSWGIGCANYKYPGVYVRVKRFVKWIRKCMRKY